MTIHKPLATFTVAILALISVAQADSTKLVNPNNWHTYQGIDSNMTWEDGETYCKSKGGHLATITSSEENEFVFQNIAKNMSTGGSWIGGWDLGGDNWTWITGEKLLYTNWSPGEPNDSGDSMQIYTSNGMWDDYCGSTETSWVCDSPFSQNFICEWDYSYSQYLDVITIPDVNGDQMMDQVVLAMNSGNFYLKTIDSATGKQLKQVALGAATTITPSALTTVGTQISVLITKSTGISVLQLRDNTTLALVKTLTLPK